MLDNPEQSCLPCGLHEPKRNAYFDGKLLTARDFTDEQDYGRGLRRLHNSLLHGTGTVCGLKIIQHPAAGCRNEYVVVEPGMALDCCGNEIIVPEKTGVNIAGMLAKDPDLAASLDGSKHLFISIARCDKGAEKIPVLLPGCGAEGSEAFGRIAEGFKFVLEAIDEKTIVPFTAPVTAKMEWVHTIALGAQTPRALHVNETEQWLQIATDTSSKGAQLYLHRSDTNDLASILEMSGRATDTASSREDRLVFAAGQFSKGTKNIPGIGVWRAGEALTSGKPIAVMECEFPASRISVSPTSGSLFILNFDTAKGVLISISSDNVRNWLADANRPARPAETATVKFSHGFGKETDAAARGAAMMRVSNDGRFLAIASAAGEPAKHLFLFDISKLNGGGMTAGDALVTDLPVRDDQRLCSLGWSLDSELLYLLTNAVNGKLATVHRFLLTGNKNELVRQGQGASLKGTGLDLAIAPTESHAYVLMAGEKGAVLTTVDMEVIKADNEKPAEVQLAKNAVTIDGTGLSLALAPNGSRAYVAAADSDTAKLPDRGLVAIIDISQDDCGIYFDQIIDECSQCGNEEKSHAVVLGHLPNYKAAAKPFMIDAGAGGTNIVEIDNKKYRPVVPSASTLREVIECILAQGVAEGPPGPRGEPGLQGATGQAGAAGKSITAVTVASGPVGSQPQATTATGQTGITVNLTLPAPAPGTPGAAGAGIDKATIVFDSALSSPQVSITGTSPNRTLAIRLPQLQAPQEDLNKIIALSWKHARPIASLSSFVAQLKGKGIALAFEKPVDWQPFTGGEKAGPTMLAELQVRNRAANGTFVWATLELIEAHPATGFKFGTPDPTLITDWTLQATATETQGFALKAATAFKLELPAGEPVRLVFYTDFVTSGGKSPLDGSHIGGTVPTGRGAAGDTFRSWFTIDG
jgi:hypothetical protein